MGAKTWATWETTTGTTGGVANVVVAVSTERARHVLQSSAGGACGAGWSGFSGSVGVVEACVAPGAWKQQPAWAWGAGTSDAVWQPLWPWAIRRCAAGAMPMATMNAAKSSTKNGARGVARMGEI